MTDRDDESRISILEAYEKAKKANPGLTQGQFMMRGAPGTSGAYDKAKTGNFKSEASAARYFRKLKTGERTGGAMYRETKSKSRSGAFQAIIRVRDANGNERMMSQNILVGGGGSSFDIPAVEDELRKPANMARFRATHERMAAKYAIPSTDFDPRRIEVRPVQNQHAPIRMRLSLD